MDTVFDFLLTLGELLVTTPIGAILLGVVLVSFVSKVVRS